MSSLHFFKLNTPNVVQETIDGEVVIVDLKKGYYYSLVGTGAEIWSYIEQGISQEEIIAIFKQKYLGEEDNLTSTINSFLESLLSEEILILDHKTEEKFILESIEIKEKLPLNPPKLTKYTDMEDLLALDPIHEVDEMGWPNAKIETQV